MCAPCCYWKIFFLFSFPLVAPLFAQQNKSEGKEALGATWETRVDARTIYRSIPAPRGQITDRNGYPLAQTKVAYCLGVSFTQFFEENPGVERQNIDVEEDQQELLRYVYEQINLANSVLGGDWKVKEKEVLEHYKHRHWVPYLFTYHLSEKKTEKISPYVGKGLILQPSYVRVYPEGKTAGHIIGYAGKKRPLPTGPLHPDDPVFLPLKGRAGLEMTFDSDLDGKEGALHVLFDAKGEKLAEEVLRAPVPGNTIVTTLDLKMQQMAEKTLQNYTRIGAFVVIDVKTGDILTLASYPSFDPNDFIPFITEEKFSALRDDKRKPLLARAFSGVYPPASTFKICTGLAALKKGIVSSDSTIDCPPKLKLGNRWFHNAGKGSYGHITLKSAIKYSCNTWFYRSGIRTGAKALTEMSRQLGFGEKTGIPLPGEQAGFVPSNAYWVEKFGRPMAHGDIANFSIGQGMMEATPLQVAQMMAAVANEKFLPRLQLIRQIQFPNGGVFRNFPPVMRHALDIDASQLKVVRDGMIAVVQSGGGTGRSGGNSYKSVAGKTGTGEWKPHKGQKVAWFAGFVPAKNPKYAFAAFYEGRAHDSSVWGGKKAAPMARNFFNKVFKREKSRGDWVRRYSRDPLKEGEVDLAQVDSDEEGQDDRGDIEEIEEIEEGEEKVEETLSLEENDGEGRPSEGIVPVDVPKPPRPRPRAIRRIWR